MGRRKQMDVPVTMGDVAAWRQELSEAHGARLRIIWSTGAEKGAWRVTAQAVVREGDATRVVAELYDVWPKRGCSSPEALMLQLTVSLERQLDLRAPLELDEGPGA